MPGAGNTLTAAKLFCSVVRRLRCPGPSTSHRDDVVPVLRPVVERLGVKISAVGPLDGPERRVELNGVEHRQILERRKQLTLKNRTEINALLAAIVEINIVSSVIAASTSLIRTSPSS